MVTPVRVGYQFPIVENSGPTEFEKFKESIVAELNELGSRNRPAHCWNGENFFYIKNH